MPLHNLFDPSVDRNTILTALALGAVGCILLPELAKFTSWTRFHFLQPSRLHKYKRPDAWALVTGASDGIGYGFVQELASQGFNVILHGRNATKIDGLITSLQKEYPEVKFGAFVCSATDRSVWHKLDELAQSMRKEGRKLTIVVNNVGGNPKNDKTYLELKDYEPNDLNALVDMNAVFPLQISRALLPVLGEHQPSLIVNMGSVAGTDQGKFPWLVAYCGGKAFDRQFSRALRVEMDVTGKDVEVVHVVTGQVQSAGLRCSTSWTVPSSRTFAASTLAKVGGGRDEIMGYWAHSMQIWAMSLLPEWVSQRTVNDIMRGLKKDMDEENVKR